MLARRILAFSVVLLGLIYVVYWIDVYQTMGQRPTSRLADGVNQMTLKKMESAADMDFDDASAREKQHKMALKTSESVSDRNLDKGEVSAKKKQHNETPDNTLCTPDDKGDKACKSDMSSTRCVEERHLVFLRIRKTGSSIMTVMLWRFGATRGLNFLLPKKQWDRPLLKLTPGQFNLPGPGTFCDMMAVHVVYNYDLYKPYFHPDTQYVALIREPMSHLASSLYYASARPPKIDAENKVSAYLRNPERYQTANTHNPLAHYFGLQNRHYEDMKAIRNLISKIKKKFRLILIMERMSESLLLMKRKLCWSFKDILYFRHKNNQKKPNFIFTVDDYSRLEKHSAADCAIYDHFYEILAKRIVKEGPGFQDELKYYESHLKESQKFCANYSTMTATSVLRFKATPFSQSYALTKEDCRLMTTDVPILHDELRRNQAKYNYCG